MTTMRLVHLVDDDAAVRRSAGFVLKTSGYRVMLHETGEAFLKAVNGSEPACVLLDLRMPGMDGLETHRAMGERGLALPVVILTGHGDVSMAVRAMKGGAVDLIEKPFEKAEMLKAVETAFMRLNHASSLAEEARDAAVRIAALTAREHEVLRGLAQGLSNKVIASELGISPRTVEIHRANLMAGLGVKSLSEALKLAFAADQHRPSGAQAES